MVRATFAGFTTAFSALQANQKRLDITGQNLANMNTVGYTRQQLQVSSLNYSNPVSHYMSNPEIVVGYGVRMDKVAQIRDPYLDIQYRYQMQKSGYSNAMQTSLDELAKFLDESHINGINQAFNNIQATLSLAHDPAKVNDQIYEAELRSRMQALTNLLNDGARQIDTAKMNEFSRLDGEGTNEQGAIQNVNSILQQIGRLNRQIKQNEIMGQPSLELKDDRNVLLDELSSYIPIEVTYYKDKEHDGVDAKGDRTDAAKAEEYYLDSAGDVIMKKDWPEDLRVTMSYVDENGATQKLVLVEGTVGSGDDNYGQIEIGNSAAIRNGTADPSTLELKFTNCFKYPTTPGIYGEVLASSDPADPASAPTFSKTNGKISNQFASGSIQASLDMLWKDGTTPGLNDVKGYDYYMNQLDNLAYSFGTVMNTINNQHGGGNLLGGYGSYTNNVANKKDAAKNIGLHQDWVDGTSTIGTQGTNPNDCLLDMLEAMTATYPINSNFLDGSYNGYPHFMGVDLENNSFANYMNHISTVMANDSRTNQDTLKTNVTVLNGIQNSRDSMSGVSLDEEASNMMMHMSAYNAASRLMTTLDQALDVLINSTGVVGR